MGTAWTRFILIAVFFSIGLAFANEACRASDDDYTPSFSDRPTTSFYTPRYTFAVHPLHNPKLLYEKYAPLIDFINANVEGFSLKLVASRDYPTFESKLFSGRFDFALPNPLQTIASLHHGYRIIGKMGDDNLFQGIIVMRRDTGNRVMFVEDLAGASLSFPANTALAATMMPKYFLKSRGLDLDSNDIHYVGSQESAIMNVYLNKTAAAGTWPLPWGMLLKARPELEAAMEIKWRTPSLVNNGVVARTDLNADHVAAVLYNLLALHTHSRGQEILKMLEISCFEAAQEKTYEPVKKFLKDYAALFADGPSIQLMLP